MQSEQVFPKPVIVGFCEKLKDAVVGEEKVD
jgi:hypothetical protein